MSWEESYQDPLRWKDLGSGANFSCRGVPKADVIENDLCSLQLIVMHKPTNDSVREKTGQYPFAEHLSGKKRLWEVRMQVRFKQVPKSQVFFGLELSDYVSLSMITRQVQKTVIAACQGIVGDCYHSNGDNPAKVSGEPEPPTFVMPLWAFDQFEVSDVGSEPDITGSLEGRGMLRADGVQAYVKATQATMASFSLDKVYTFGFWGISRFLDIMKWELCGDLLPGMTLDFNRLCGRPPVTIAIYELANNGKEKRHLKSQKKYYFNVAAWSALYPPSDSVVAGLVAEPRIDVDEEALSAALSKVTIPEVQFVDLLSFDDEPKPQETGGYSASATAPTAPAQKVENTDLLGLM